MPIPREEKLAFINHRDFDKLVETLVDSPRYKDLDLPKHLKESLIQDDWIRWVSTPVDMTPDEQDDIEETEKEAMASANLPPEQEEMEGTEDTVRRLLGE